MVDQQLRASIVLLAATAAAILHAGCSGSDATPGTSDPAPDADIAQDAAAEMGTQEDATVEPDAEADVPAADDASQEQPSSPPDASEASTDAPQSPDADAAPDPDAAQDASPPAVAERLAFGTDLTLFGVTSDGYAVYADNQQRSLHAVSLAGGLPLELAPNVGDWPWVQIDGKVVFAWHDGGVSSAPDSKLTVWTAGQAPHTIGDDFVPFRAAVSEDGQRVVFVRWGTGATVVGANIDLAGEVQLGPLNDEGNCTAFVASVGSRFVTTSCNAGFGTMTSWDSSWAATPLFSDTRMALAPEHAHGNVFAVIDTNFTLQDQAATGGAARTYFEWVMPLADYDGSSVMVSPDGSMVLFTGMNNDVYRSATDIPAPQLIPNVYVGSIFVAISPDNGHFLATEGSGLNLSSVDAGGIIDLVPPGDTVYPAPDPFTQDSAFALALHGFFPVVLEATDVHLGTHSVLSEDVVTARSVQGSTVVYIENGGSAPTLWQVDAASPTAKELLGSFVGDDVYPTASRDAVVFTRTDTVAPGVYWVAVP